jgi:hypothetical protein
VEQLEITASSVSASSNIDAPFSITETSRPNVILLALLQRAEAMAASLPFNLRRDAISGTRPHHSHNPSSSRSSRIPFAVRIQALLENKLDYIFKYFFRIGGGATFAEPAGPKGVTKAARSGRASLSRTAKPKLADNRQGLLNRIHLLERKLSDVKARDTRKNREIDWEPIVKVSGASAKAPFAESTRSSGTDIGKQAESCDSFDLAGRCVLCVGGRASLYPAYRRLVETSGGNLLIYRCPRNGADHLPALLAHADMVVCPVDCVNHHAYFAVRRYCKRSGKPCVLLDRSCLPTFRKGVAILSSLAASTAGCRKAIQSPQSQSIT